MRQGTGDPIVDEMMSRFEYAYTKAYDHFARMERTAAAYGNKINTVTWPTISQIPFPLTFTGV